MVYDPKYLRYEERKDYGVDDVENGVEQRDSHRHRFGVVARCRRVGVWRTARHNGGHRCNQIHQRPEGEEGDDYAYDVENQMGTCGLLASGVGNHSGDVGGDGGAYVLSHHQSDSNIKSDPSVVAHNQGDSHHCRRGLDDAGKQGANGDEQQNGPETEAGHRCQPLQQVGVFFEIGHCGLQQIHTYQQQSQAYDGLAHRLEVVLVGKQEKQARRRQRQRQAEIAFAATQTEQGDDPRSHRCADVGTHNNRDGAAQRKQSGIDETDHHHCRCRRRLDCCRHSGTGKDSAQGVAGNFAQNGAHFASGHLLKTLAHHFHREKEHCQCTGKVDNNQ